MELRYHGAFPPPPADQDVPGTIAAKPKQPSANFHHQKEYEYEPSCLLQCWTGERDGRTAYLFLMYAVQAPPHEIAKAIARYFKITPSHGGHGFYDFIGVRPPNRELLRPVYTRYDFIWEWQEAKWTARGTDWVWQSSGQGIALPYAESELSPEEEKQYNQQLTELLAEIEQQEGTIALPQPKMQLLLPVFHRKNVAPQIEEKATSSTQS
jgi:hypothetical protein